MVGSILFLVINLSACELLLYNFSTIWFLMFKFSLFRLFFNFWILNFLLFNLNIVWFR